MNIGEFVDEALAIKSSENDVSKSPESFSRSTLTESQHLRMEENKRIAMEKRNQNVSQKNMSLTKEQLSPESFSRSTLTESQCLRMEENKRKAVEKRNQNVDEALANKSLADDVSKSPRSFSRSTLTESQRLRMEENKRNAMEKRNQNVSQKNMSLTKEQLSRMKENKLKALEKRSQIQKNGSSQLSLSLISGQDNNESTPTKKFKFSKREKSLEELCEENELIWSAKPGFEPGEPNKRKSNPGNTKSSI